VAASTSIGASIGLFTSHCYSLHLLTSSTTIDLPSHMVRTCGRLSDRSTRRLLSQFEVTASTAPPARQQHQPGRVGGEDFPISFYSSLLSLSVANSPRHVPRLAQLLYQLLPAPALSATSRACDSRASQPLRRPDRSFGSRHTY
jgi:hypothetical protein